MNGPNSTKRKETDGLCDTGCLKQQPWISRNPQAQRKAETFLTQTKQAVFQYNKLDRALLPIWCCPGLAATWLLYTSGSPQFPPVPPPQQALLGLQLHSDAPVLGVSHPLLVKSKTPVFRNTKCQCQGTSPPHTSHNTRALWALEVCEEVSGEEQCSRRGAAASAARCSKVSLKQEQSAQISTTSPKVSGSRYFGKACKK